MRRRAALGLLGAGLLGTAPVAAYVVSAGRDTPERVKMLDPTSALKRTYRAVPDRNGRTLLLSLDDERTVAVLTVGARTVLLAGPQRVFTEPSTTRASVHSGWLVRVGPTPWRDGAHLDEQDDWARWLTDTIGATTTDVLHTATQYLHRVPRQGHTGDAGFGLEGRDGADFYDCLGIEWSFPDVGSRRPDPRWRWMLDCSGFLRLVYGWWHGVSLYGGNSTRGTGLPRSAWAIAKHAPAVPVAAGRRSSRPPEDLGDVQPGDLVFFALHDSTPGRITHSGICLGNDGQGRMRFVSSRGTADGPTFGDVRGLGVIDDGYFAARLRRVIRL